MEGKVRLDWYTATETNNSGFTIQRSTDGATYENIFLLAEMEQAQPEMFTAI